MRLFSRESLMCSPRPTTWSPAILRCDRLEDRTVPDATMFDLTHAAPGAWNVVVTNPDSTSLALAAHAGFQIIGDESEPGLGIRVVTLAIPKRMNVRQAMKTIRKTAPALQVDFNHVYEPSGGALLPVAGALLIAIVTVGYPIISERADFLFSDWNALATKGDHSTALGLRVALWQIGLGAFRDAPIFGHGIAASQALMHQGFQDQFGLDRGFSHFHNGFLTALVQAGLLGAITLATAESGRRYNKADLAFGEDLASRTAIGPHAVDSIRR